MTRWELKERTQSGRAETLRQFMVYAGTLGFAFAFSLSGIYRVSSVELASFVRDGLQGQLDAIVYVRLIVYVVLFLFGLLWGQNGFYELHLLQDWLKPEHFTVKRRNLVHATTIIIGVLLGILFALTPDFTTLVYVFIFYTLVDLFLWKLREDEIARLLEDNSRTLDRDVKKLSGDDTASREMRSRLALFRQGANFLKEYYLLRSHYGRVGIQLAGMAALAVCPLLWEFIHPGRVPKEFTVDGITIVGYLIFVWCLSLSEVTVYIWRQDLDTRLAALARRLHDLDASLMAGRPRMP